MKNFKTIYQLFPQCLFKLQAFWLLFSFVFLTLYPSVQIFGNPLVPGALTPDTLDVERLGESIRRANTQRDLNTWNSQVYGELDLMQAEWESKVQEQIEAQVISAFHKDAFVNNPGYKDYLRKELESAKASALHDWQANADMMILFNRNNYVKYMSGQNYQEHTENTQSNQQTTEQELDEDGKSFNQLTGKLDEAVSGWNKDFQNSYETGLTNFQNDLNSINADYKSFTDQLDQADAKFKGNLSAIESYVETVKGHISGSVKGLQDSLNNNPELYKNSDGTLNTSGTQLSGLITEMNTSLNDPNAKFTTVLTTVATKMTEYLRTQRKAVQDKADKYAQDAVFSPEINNEISASYKSPINKPSFDRVKNIIKMGNTADPDVLSFIGDYIKTQLNSYNSSYDSRTGVKKDKYSLQLVKGIELRAHSGVTNHIPHEFFRVGGTYSQGNPDESFDTYDRKTYYCLGVYLCGYRDYVEQEEEIHIKLNVTMQDNEAAENQVTWQGFANNLTSQFTEWQDKILPAVTNWEVQVKNYQNFYEAWKTKAANLRQTAKDNHTTATNDLQRSKGKWLQDMANAKRKAQGKWNELQEKLDEKQPKEAALLVQQAQSSFQGIAIPTSQTSQNDKNATAANFSASLAKLKQSRVQFRRVAAPKLASAAELIAQDKLKSLPKVNLANLDLLGAPSDRLEQIGNKKFVAKKQLVAQKGAFQKKQFGLHSQGFGVRGGLASLNEVDGESYNIFNHGFEVGNLKDLKLEEKFGTTLNGVKQYSYISAVNETIDTNVDEYQQQIFDQIVNSYRFQVKGKFYDKDGNFDDSKLSDEQKKLHSTGKCVANGELVAACAEFMERNEMFESAHRVGDEIVVNFKISDGTAHKATEGEGEYKGYNSGKQTRTRRISLSSVAHINAPKGKSLFDKWTNEDYIAINNKLYGEYDKDGKKVEGKDGLITKLYQNFNDDMQRFGSAYQNMSALNQTYLQRFRSNADRLDAHEKLMEELMQAYLTGGMKGLKASAKDMLKRNIDQKINEGLAWQLGKFQGLSDEEIEQQVASMSDVISIVRGRMESNRLKKKINSPINKMISSSIASISRIPIFGPPLGMLAKPIIQFASAAACAAPGMQMAAAAGAGGCGKGVSDAFAKAEKTKKRYTELLAKEASIIKRHTVNNIAAATNLPHDALHKFWAGMEGRKSARLAKRNAGP
ncbi:MAG: TIGR04388 family protein, partial [Spirochaetota bacterium]